MKTNHTPLQKINQFLQAIPTDVMQEIAWLSSSFHPSENVQRQYSEQQVKGFFDYITEKGLDNNQVVSRTLIVLKLVDVILAGRNSNEKWTKSLDVNLSIASDLQREGQKLAAVDTFFDTFTERKDRWITTSQNWEVFKATEISDEQIMDWYMQSIADKHNKL